MLPKSHPTILGLTLAVGQLLEVRVHLLLVRILTGQLDPWHWSAQFCESQLKEGLTQIDLPEPLLVRRQLVEVHTAFGVILAGFGFHRNKSNLSIDDHGVEPRVPVRIEVHPGDFDRERFVGPEDQVQRGTMLHDQQRAGLDRRFDLGYAAVLRDLLADKVLRDVRRFGKAGYRSDFVICDDE